MQHNNVHIEIYFKRLADALSVFSVICVVLKRRMEVQFGRTTLPQHKQIFTN